MVKIMHVINGLNTGGAEHMLYKLIKNSVSNTEFLHEVISLKGEGYWKNKIEDLGISVHTLGLRKTNFLSNIIQAKKLCKNADIINTWLYASDFFGYIIAKVFLKKKLIWNIRQSNLDRKYNSRSTNILLKINALLSKKVDVITYNSRKAHFNHINRKYYDKNSLIIFNGFDKDSIYYSLECRNRIRDHLGISKNYLVFITVGRWDIQKDYYTLLKGLQLFKSHSIDFKLMMIGRDLVESNSSLVSEIEKRGLSDDVFLLGEKSNIKDYLSAGDIYVSSSLGESFSNAIAEAMLCELTCVVTDVGDSRYIVNGSGFVVEPNNPIRLSESLVKAYEHIHSLGRKNKNARENIIKNYSIEKLVNSYNELFSNKTKF